MPFFLHHFYLSLNLLLFRLVKFLVQVLGARVLAPAAFGYFSYLYSLMDIWNHVFGAGLDIRAARTRAAGPEAWPPITTGRFFLSLAGAGAGLAVFQWPYNLLFALWHVGFLQSRLAYSYVNTLLFPKGIVLSGLASQAALLAGAYWGLKLWGLAGFIGAFALERLIEAGFLYGFAARLEPSLLGRLREATAPRVWVPSLRQWISREGGGVIAAGQLIGVLSARLDTVLVQALLGYSALASYSLAVRTCEAPLFLFAALAESSLAYFVRHPQERPQLWARSLTMALLAGFGLALAVSLFGFLAASWVFGAQYQGLGPLIAVSSWVLIPRGVNMVSSSFLLASGGEKILLVTSASGMMFGLLANIALIPWFGVWAPAVVATVAELVTAVLRYRLIPKG